MALPNLHMAIHMHRGAGGIDNQIALPVHHRLHPGLRPHIERHDIGRGLEPQQPPQRLLPLAGSPTQRRSWRLDKTDAVDAVASKATEGKTRREARQAHKRQLAGDILAATYPADFRRELASAFRALTGSKFGDNPAHLATDACA